MEVILKLKVCDAKLYRDTELGGKMDPYVNLTIGDQKLKTKTHEDAGKYPKWDESFTVKTKLNTNFKFVVMDKETVMSDDLIGEGSFDLVKNYALTKKVINAPLAFKGELAGEVRMEIELEVEEKYHKQLRAELEAEVQDKKNLVEALKRQEKKELPKQLIFTPPAPKKGEALEEAEEKALKDEAAKLKKELEEVSKVREVRENDRADMLRRMLSGTLIQGQLKKHIDQVKKQIEDFSKNSEFFKTFLIKIERIDIKGTVVVKVLRAKLTRGGTDPIVYVTFGKKAKRSKTQDEDTKNPVWNETLQFERTENDESVLVLWVLDEGFKDFPLGVTVLSVYPAIFSKLNEKYIVPLFLGGETVGELIFHVEFKRKE